MEPAEGRTATGSPIEFDAALGSYRVAFDRPTADAVAVVVSSAVAAAEGVDHAALPALNDVLDPEAIDRVLASAREASGRTRVEVAFTYAGYRVSIRPREVVLRPLDADLGRGESAGRWGPGVQGPAWSIDAGDEAPTE